MFFVSITVKRSPLSLSLPFSLCLTHQSTNPIFWSRHGNTTLSLPSESRKNLKLLRAQSWGNSLCPMRRSLCADRGDPETRFLATCQFSARDGALIASVVTMNGDRCTRHSGRRMNVSMERYLWSVARLALGIVAIELERRKISFFFTFLREKSRDWKLEGLFLFLMLIIAEWMLSKLRINIGFFYKFQQSAITLKRNITLYVW